MNTDLSRPKEPLCGGSKDAWFRALLPPDVVAVEGLLSEAQGNLFDVEAAAIGKAVDKRRREFSAGRFMAHNALRMLLGDQQPVPMAADRSPQWPAGVVGSITHTDHRAAAAVARADAWASVGIDMNETSGFDPGLARLICTPDERQLALPLHLVFSAKEALYKCQYPLTQQWMDFGDAEISLPGDAIAAAGRFTATLTKACGGFPQGYRFEGRWCEKSEIIATSVCLAR